MKFINVLQGTPEWAQLRSGKVTASCYCDAVSTVGGLTEQQTKYVAAINNGSSAKDAATIAGYKAPPTADNVRRALAGEVVEQPSDTAKRYAADISIERVSKKPHGQPAKAWVLERGHEMEFAARMKYEARTKAYVTESGICVDNTDWFAYSSDGLVDADGLIEIKAPIDSQKILTMWQTGDVSEYMHQMQGGMWITGRNWCDFIMYVPDLEPVGKDMFIKRIHRDDVFIDAMVHQLVTFQALAKSYEAVWRAANGAGVGVPQAEIKMVMTTPPPAPSWRDQISQ